MNFFAKKARFCMTTHRKSNHQAMIHVPIKHFHNNYMHFFIQKVIKLDFCMITYRKSNHRAMIPFRIYNHYVRSFFPQMNIEDSCMYWSINYEVVTLFKEINNCSV